MGKSRYKYKFGRCTCEIKTHTSPKVINSQRLWGMINSQPYGGDKQPPTTRWRGEAKRAAAASLKGGGDGEGGHGDGGSDGSGGEAPVARVAQGWRRERRRAPELEVVRGGDGEGRAGDGHVAGDGGQQEQHALAELDHDLILVADLPWKSRQGVRVRGGDGRRMPRQGNAHELALRPCR